MPDLSVLGGAEKITTYDTPDGAISFRYPKTWTVTVGGAPLVAELASGGALAAIYAYPRKDLGTDGAAVRASRKRVLASLEDRAPGFLIQGSRIFEVDGSPAVQVIGRGLIDDTIVRTRSVHVYKEDTEWVINAYARRDDYDTANRIAFDRLIRTAKLVDTLPNEKD